MGLTALIMAGGRSSRIGSNAEKPLLEISGKPMIQMVIEALKESVNIDQILVATSPNTPQTSLKAKEMGVDVVQTSGAGYEPDMKSAISQRKLRDVLVVSSDLPFLTTSLIDRAVITYRSSGKPALCVMAPVGLIESTGAVPSCTYRINNQILAPIGLNILDGRRINEPQLEEVQLIVGSGEKASILNVNTMRELELAREKQTSERGNYGEKT
jgi:adenosylcobinamide-phosphate guanylyltransferase